VNNVSAITNGALADNPRFFGSATAEVISRASIDGGWNGDRQYSIYSDTPWLIGGGRSSLGTTTAGVFSIHGAAGGVNQHASHRTILSGY
jgi:hypothetical protein